MMENLKRLIDANKIKYTEYRKGGGREYPENVVTEDEIAKMPTVDAVEVVRCKDCAWSNQVEDLRYCENPNAPWIDEPDFSEITVAENDFCSYGERRTDG